MTVDSRALDEGHRWGTFLRRSLDEFTLHESPSSLLPATRSDIAGCTVNIQHLCTLIYFLHIQDTVDPIERVSERARVSARAREPEGQIVSVSYIYICIYIPRHART